MCRQWLFHARALLACLLVLCGALAPVHAGATPVHAGAASETLLFHNGRIHLNDESGTVATALLVRDGRVLAAGAVEAISARPDAQGARRVDLEEGTAVPGLQDAHAHLEAYASSLDQFDVTGVPTYAALIERVREKAKGQKEGTWIVGRGWDQNLWPEKGPPHHLLLSSAVPKHPVFLLRADGHAVLVNKAALALAKLDGDIDPDAVVSGGRVLLDDENRATGVLLDEGMRSVEALIPLEPLALRVKRMLRVQDNLLALGLTAVHDMGTRPATLELFKELRRAGQLRLRIVAYIWGNGAFTPERIEGLPLAPDARDLLCVPGVKFMADGALAAREAALFEDYSDAPGERGHLILTEAELGARLALAVKHGLQPAVHAIGDRATSLVLDLYAKLDAAMPAYKSLRPRIEHAQVVAPKDWERFPDLNVLPSMQPVRALSETEWLAARLGESRTHGAFAWRTLAPDIGRLAFGSDFPTTSPNPLLGLYAARTPPTEKVEPVKGKLPMHRLDARGALAAFTSGAAYACFQEDRRGRLTPGYFADITVIDRDPIACAPSELLKARVTMTVINGEIVYVAR